MSNLPTRNRLDVASSTCCTLPAIVDRSKAAAVVARSKNDENHGHQRRACNVSNNSNGPSFLPDLVSSRSLLGSKIYDDEHDSRLSLRKNTPNFRGVHSHLTAEHHVKAGCKRSDYHHHQFTACSQKCPQVDTPSEVDEPQNLVRHKMLKPSEYLLELSRSNQSTFMEMRDHKLKGIKRPITRYHTQASRQLTPADGSVQVYPDHVILYNFVPLKKYDVPIMIRNEDVIAHNVEFICDPSPYFNIICPDQHCCRIRPGLSITLRIQFTGDADRDYSHNVRCRVQTQSFDGLAVEYMLIDIPFFAMGPRAILNFPDKLCFHTCPVRYEVVKTVAVKNIGNKVASFKFTCEEPFQVQPESGLVEVGEELRLEVFFCALAVGQHNKDLVLRYDTGELIKIQLCGCAESAPISLSYSTLDMGEQYVNMKTQKTVTILNHSDVIVHFQWKKFALAELERQHREQLMAVSSSECDFLSDILYATGPHEHGQTHQHSIHASQSIQTIRHNARNTLAFDSQTFLIDDIEGEVWPDSSLDIAVLFKPDSCGDHSAIAFCEVTGREHRLPLVLHGVARGPRIQLSLDELDLGQIFINGYCSYTFVIANRGSVDASYNVQKLDTKFGACFEFSPSRASLPVEGYQEVRVTFRAREDIGDFCESFGLNVDGSCETPTIKFSGAVIAPTFTIDVTRFDFGSIAYGCTETKKFTINNTSFVPISFLLRVPGDGFGEPDCIDGYFTAKPSQPRTTAPIGSDQPNLSPSFLLLTGKRQFDLEPNGGTVPALSSIQVLLRVCLNTPGEHAAELNFDIVNIGKGLHKIPITARCIIPEISLLTPVLNPGRCYLNAENPTWLTLRNKSSFRAKYHVRKRSLTQDKSCPDCLSYGSPQPIGYLEPCETRNVPLLVTAHKVGPLEMKGDIKIHGIPYPLEFLITCQGEGPVVFVDPISLSWGTISVLTPITKIIRLSNESIIPATVTARLTGPADGYSVPVGEISMLPHETVELKVVAYFREAVQFSDDLQIDVIDGTTRQVHLFGTGLGTSLVVTPPMSDVLENLGCLFVGEVCRRVFTVTNQGTRSRNIRWTARCPQTAGELARQKAARAAIKTQKLATNTRRKICEPLPGPEPIFKVKPTCFDVEPGESITFVIEGTVDREQLVLETLSGFDVVASRTRPIPVVEIRCEFIIPSISFSSKFISFRHEHHQNASLLQQRQPVALTNSCKLPMNATLVLNHPFTFVCGTTRQELSFGLSEMKTIFIEFDPSFNNVEGFLEDYHTRSIQSTLDISYKESTQNKDMMTLVGEVVFPNVEFEMTNIDFDCIANDTESTRYVIVTNNGPIAVDYSWMFVGEKDPRHAIQFPTEGVANYRRSASSISENDSQEIPSTYQMMPDGVTHTSVVRHQEQTEVMGGSVVSISAVCGSEPTALAGSHISTVSIASGDHGAVKDQLAATPIHQPKRFSEISEVGSEDEIRNPCQCSETSSSVCKEHHVSTSLERGKTLELEVLATNPKKSSIGITDIFDVMPVFGTIEPGMTQCFTFTFFGHAFIDCQTVAQFKVTRGPTYECVLKGQASSLQYLFSTHYINFGKIRYDEIAIGWVTLECLGGLGFEFEVTGSQRADSSQPLIAGIPLVYPQSGFVGARSELTLTVKYAPLAADKFHSSFQICVAKCEQTTIRLCGEGSFLSIALNVPRYLDEEGRYKALRAEAVAILERRAIKKRKLDAMGRRQGWDERILRISKETSKVRHKPLISVRHSLGGRVLEQIIAEVHSQVSINLSENQSSANSLSETEDASEEEDVETIDKNACQERTSFHLNEVDIEEQINRLAVNEFIRTHYYAHLPDVNENRLTLINTTDIRAYFPEYVLNFGPVISSLDHIRLITVTNSGQDNVLLTMGQRLYERKGFTIDQPKSGIHQVQAGHTNVLHIKFEPQKANLPLGIVSCRAVFNIEDGPQVLLRLTANVVVPSLSITTDQLHFADTKVGECHIITIQLHNSGLVDCYWSTRPRQNVKYSRSYKKYLSELVYETTPDSGFLNVGERMNIHIKFTPLEEKLYTQNLYMRFDDNPNTLALHCNGQGLEPRVVLVEPNIVFDPSLPYINQKKELILRNPCPFPIEVFSVQYDDVHRYEEKILRMLIDKVGLIYLPTRNAGEKLPANIITYYESVGVREDRNQHQRTVTLMTESKGTIFTADDISMVNLTAGSVQTQLNPRFLKNASTDKVMNEQRSISSSQSPVSSSNSYFADSITLQDLHLTPLSEAVAYHTGILEVTNPEVAKENNTISIIVHGAPVSGKSRLAAELGRQYNVPVISLDALIIEAMTSSSLPAAVQAYSLCLEAELNRAKEEELKNAAPDAAKKGKGKGGKNKGEKKAGKNKNDTEVISQTPYADSLLQSCSTDPSALMPFAVPPPEAVYVVRKPIDVAADPNKHVQIQTSPAPLEEIRLLSVVLPNDIVMEILRARIARPDTYFGMVFDGLNSMFVKNTVESLYIILHCLGCRKRIYCVDLKFDYASLINIKEKERQTIVEQQARKVATERVYFDNLDEDAYNALSPRARACTDSIQARRNKERVEKLGEEERQKRLAKEETALKLLQQQLDEKRLAVDSKQSKKMRAPSTDVPAQSVGDLPKLKHADTIHLENKAEETTELLQTPSALIKAQAQRLLQRRFLTYELFRKDTYNLLTFWSRNTGERWLPPAPDDDDGGKKKKKNAAKEKPKKNQKATCYLKDEPTLEVDPSSVACETKPNEMNVGISSTTIDIANIDHKSILPVIVERLLIPTHNEILDSMGIGPSGPIVPPPISLVPLDNLTVRPIYEKCNLVLQEKDSHGKDSVTEGTDDGKPYWRMTKRASKRKSDVAIGLRRQPIQAANALAESPNSMDPVSSVSRNSSIAVSRRSSSASPSSTVRRMSRRLSRKLSQLNRLTPDVRFVNLAFNMGRLAATRWVIPANGEVSLMLSFTPEEAGLYNEVIHFEVVGVRNKACALTCQALCALPFMRVDPSFMFQRSLPNKRKCQIVHKAYVVETETFEFGPILLGLPINSDTYREMVQETLKFRNTSQLRVQATLVFLEDQTGRVFDVNPKSFELEVGQEQEINIIAYPTSEESITDELLCLVENSPEVMQLKVHAVGAKPRLSVDKSMLNFERILQSDFTMKPRKKSPQKKNALTRNELPRETIVLTLGNQTMVPLQWCADMTEFEDLRGVFCLSQESGVIQPQTCFHLEITFAPENTVIVIADRSLTLEVYDVNQVLGCVQKEVIKVNAESYRTSIQMTFEGGVCGLDYDYLKLLEEKVKSMVLKNIGKYDIKYELIMKPIPMKPIPMKPNPIKLMPTKPVPVKPILRFGSACSMFVITPSEGFLRPDESVQVKVTLIPIKEMRLHEKPLLHCLVYDAYNPPPPPVQALSHAGIRKTSVMQSVQISTSLSTHSKTRIDPIIFNKAGEMAADLAVNVTFVATYVKYCVEPRQLSFGTLLIIAAKATGEVPTKTFMITNASPRFPLFFFITKRLTADEMAALEKKSAGKKVTRKLPPLPKPPPPVNAKGSKPEKVVKYSGPKLTVGAFTLYPPSAAILPGDTAVITVQCTPTVVGAQNAEFFVEILNSKPSPNVPAPGLFVSCDAIGAIPTIDIGNTVEMFEEHRICRTTKDFLELNDRISTGVYLEEDKQYMFNTILAGSSVTARFKLTNSKKLPCDVTFSLGPVETFVLSNSGEVSLTTRKHGEVVFEVQPMDVVVPAEGFAYVSVTFTPPAAARRYGTILEVIANKDTISLPISGDAIQPRVDVIEPTLLDKEDIPVLVFPHCLLGDKLTKEFTVINTSILPCPIDVDLSDDNYVFTVIPNLIKDADCCETVEEGVKTMHAAKCIIPPGAKASFTVSFNGRFSLRASAVVRLILLENRAEDVTIRIIAQAYVSDVTFDIWHTGQESGKAVLYAAPSMVAGASLNEGGNDFDESSEPKELIQALQCNTLSFKDCHIDEKKRLVVSIRNRSADHTIRFEWNSRQRQVFSFEPRVGYIEPCGTKDIFITFSSPVPIFLTNEVISCGLSKIGLLEEEEGGERGGSCSWDDTQKKIEWIETSPPRQMKTIRKRSTIAINDTPTTMPHKSSLTRSHRGSSTSIVLNPKVLERSNSILGRSPTSDTPNRGHDQLVHGSPQDSDVSPRNSPEHLTVTPDRIPHAPKKKALVDVPEPLNYVVDGSQRNVDFYANATADFCEFSLETTSGPNERIFFRNTPILQRRVQKLRLVNMGTVRLNYSFKITRAGQHTAAEVLYDRNQHSDCSTPPPTSAVDGSCCGKPAVLPENNHQKKKGKEEVAEQYTPFSVEPSCGTIETRGNETIVVKFAPLDDQLCTATLTCTVSNMKKEVQSSLGDTIATEQKLSFVGINTNQDGASNATESQVHINLSGQGTVPIAHFELEDSDYMQRHQKIGADGTSITPSTKTTGRSAQSLSVASLTSPRKSQHQKRGTRIDEDVVESLEPSGPAIIEFHGTGLGVEVTRRFKVVNITKDDYFYSWEQTTDPSIPALDAGSSVALPPVLTVPPIKQTGRAKSKDIASVIQPVEIVVEKKPEPKFKCETARGVLKSGKKTEIIFRVKPLTYDTVTSFWNFNVISANVSRTFMLTLETCEPRVTFDRAHLNFGTVVNGQGYRLTRTIKLINNDEMPFLFGISSCSLCSTDGSTQLSVKPLNGLLQPKSSIPISLSISTTIDGEVSFNVECTVERRSTPLKLNVKAEGYSIRARLLEENRDDTLEKIELSASAENVIDLGKLEQSDHQSFRRIAILNINRYAVDYVWIFLNSRASRFHLTLKPLSGKIKPGESCECLMTWDPKGKTIDFSKCLIQLKIEYGPTFLIRPTSTEAGWGGPVKEPPPSDPKVKNKAKKK